jgi:DNA-binding response OmpR family regulator
VFVLSSWPEDAPRHRLAAAHIAADRYLVKPPDLDAFLALGGALRQLHQEALARWRQKFACA